MQVIPWVPYGSSTPTCAKTHWYFNVVKCCLKIIRELFENPVAVASLMILSNGDVNVNDLQRLAERLDEFLTTQTRATIDFDDFKNIFEASFQ